MRLSFSFRFAFPLLFLLAACNSGEAPSLLNQPPYNTLTDSIAKTPTDAALYYRRGSLLYGNGQPAEAEKDLRKAWELDPSEAHALSLTTLLKQKNPVAAVSFLNEALQKQPGSIALQIGLARGYQQQKDTARALGICNAVLQQYPGQIDALMLKAELLQAKQETGESLASLEKAYALRPDDVELVHTLAFQYAESKNPKALSLSDSLIRADVAGSHAEPYYFKGVYYANTGNSAEALRQFDAAIQHNYNYINAYINKGIIYYDGKQYAQALKTFSLAARVFPADADPYYWLAKTQEATGNKDDARLNYQRAYGLDKTLTEAKAAADRL